MGIEYDQGRGRRTVYDKDQTPILTVTYSSHGLPISWKPANIRTLNITYDRLISFKNYSFCFFVNFLCYAIKFVCVNRFNRVEGWKWGSQAETYTYDRHGLLSEVKTKQDGVVRYSYNELNLVSI